MRTPPGFEEGKNPLRHRLLYGCGLNMKSDTKNTVMMPIVHSSTDMATNPQPDTIVVNPHNADYVEDAGPLVRQGSIIDRMRISLKFNMTEACGPAHHSSGQSTSELFSGEDIPSFTFLWRPIFNVYPEKLDAADDDTGTTVAAILGLTKDATFEDVVPITTNKLVIAGDGELDVPFSSVNDIQVIGDFNYTASATMEDHVFDEDLLQTALKRYTNKGALRSCLGRTRHVTLTRNRPNAHFYIDKPVPQAIRRVQKYGMFGIQVHMPISIHPSQHFQSSTHMTANTVHLGVKMIASYHEWNNEHDQSKLATV